MVSGTLPPPGEAGFLVQEETYGAMSSWTEPIGSMVRFTANIDNRSFAIRELRLYGVFRLPVDDPSLRGLVLVDQDSARALAGLRAGADDAVLSELDAGLLAGDLDELFGGGMDLSDPVPAASGLLEGLEDLFAAQALEPAASAGDDVGPWHFMLVKLAPDAKVDDVRAILKGGGLDPDNDLLVRDWRATIGGSALLSYVLQLVLNAGALFVILGVLLLATNAMMLSIFERTAEFGLLRAMGASKAYVSMLVMTESFAVVVGSAAAGLGLGALGTIALNRAAIEVTNPYLVMLLGGGLVRSRLDLPLAAWHLAAAALMAFAAGYAPLRKVLGIQPSRAMA